MAPAPSATVGPPHRVHLVMMRTAGPAPALRDFWVARTVVGALQDLDEEGRAGSLAFLLLPRRCHWIVEPRRDPVATLVRVLITRTGGQQALRWSAWRAWPVAGDHAVAPLVSRLLAGAIRAGVVRRPGDYPLWDCSWL